MVRNLTTPANTEHHLIWIFAGNLGAKLSAASRLETTRHLRRLGWKVTLINTCSENVHQIRGVDVLCFSTIDRYFLRQYVYHWKVICYLLKQKPPADVILFHQDSGLWIFPLIFLRNLSGKSRPLYVLDSRSVSMPDPKKRTIKYGLRGFYIEAMNWIANHWVDGQTAITRRIADRLHIPPEKLWGIWSSGVNLEQFTPAISARHWPEPGAPIALIYIGSMEDERNLMNFCRAVEKAHVLGMTFHLTLLGKGVQWVDLERYAQGTDGRITMLPTVPHAQVVDFLIRAHVGVLPFPDEEKFRVSSPVKLFEYMASGLVILATRIACHTDVIGDNPCVFWVEGSSVDDFVAALERVWNDRFSLSKIGSNGLAVARNYSWEESARKLKNALEYGLNKGR